MLDIKPEALYSERDLTLELGVGPMAQEKERKAGRLKGTQVGTDWVYRGSDLRTWLDKKTTAASSTSPPAAAKVAAAPPSITSAGPSLPVFQETQMTPTQVQQEAAAFETTVRGLIDSGLPRQKAFAQAARSLPSLHASYLATTTQIHRDKAGKPGQSPAAVHRSLIARGMRS